MFRWLKSRIVCRLSLAPLPQLLQAVHCMSVRISAAAHHPGLSPRTALATVSTLQVEANVCWSNATQVRLCLRSPKRPCWNLPLKSLLGCAQWPPFTPKLHAASLFSSACTLTCPCDPAPSSFLFPMPQSFGRSMVQTGAATLCPCMKCFLVFPV